MSGLDGIPVEIDWPTYRGNPEILKQWQAIDEDKKRKKAEKELRIEKKKKRNPKVKRKGPKKNPRIVKDK